MKLGGLTVRSVASIAITPEDDLPALSLEERRAIVGMLRVIEDEERKLTCFQITLGSPSFQFSGVPIVK